ncbi:hypothetical protein TNCV_3725691 [Trichonephila clavipes]|nr:hypothetical protein TNCV_3725691 [Trichonephila clavipes]
MTYISHPELHPTEFVKVFLIFNIGLLGDQEVACPPRKTKIADSMPVRIDKFSRCENRRHACHVIMWTATAGSDVVQSGRPNFDDFFQHLRPYFGNNTANVVFQMVKRLWLIRIDQ